MECLLWKHANDREIGFFHYQCLVLCETVITQTRIRIAVFNTNFTVRIQKVITLCFLHQNKLKVKSWETYSLLMHERCLLVVFMITLQIQSLLFKLVECIRSAHLYLLRVVFLEIFVKSLLVQIRRHFLSI